MDTHRLSADHSSVISRQEAKALGMKTYQSGRPCSVGHDGVRYVITDACYVCRKTYRERTSSFGARCSVSGCKKKRDAKGFCPAHYARWKVYGDPLAGGVRNGDGLKWLADNVEYDGENCLIWPFGASEEDLGRDKGYAMTYVDGVVTGAHIVMCQLVHGDRPSEDHVAAHSCGNGHKACVHPKHLRWATRSENEADKHLHGTKGVGADSHLAKLTEDDVRRIRTLGSVMTQRGLGRMFGVCHSTIARILSGRTWFNLD